MALVDLAISSILFILFITGVATRHHLQGWLFHCFTLEGEPNYYSGYIQQYEPFSELPSNTDSAQREPVSLVSLESYRDGTA